MEKRFERRLVEADVEGGAPCLFLNEHQDAMAVPASTEARGDCILKGTKLSRMTRASSHPASSKTSTVYAGVGKTRIATKQSGLEVLLLRANAQVTDLKHKLKAATVNERKFLAAELHDDVQQILFGLSLNMATSRSELMGQLSTDLVGGWMLIVQTAMDHLHDLTLVLRQPLIGEQDLPGDMRSYIEGLPLAPNQKVVFKTHAIVGRLAPDVALACFRVVQEALGNAIQHSGGTNLLVRLLVPSVA